MAALVGGQQCGWPVRSRLIGRQPGITVLATTSPSPSQAAKPCPSLQYLLCLAAATSTKPCIPWPVDYLWNLLKDRQEPLDTHKERHQMSCSLNPITPASHFCASGYSSQSSTNSWPRPALLSKA